MRVPIEWLKEYVTIRLSPEALAERLTMAGLEVTGIERVNGEPVLDIEVTPNRADCLSIIGIAREVVAITGQRLRVPKAVHGSRFMVRGKGKKDTSVAMNHEPRTDLTIRIEDRQGCQRYIGRLIERVTIGPSPEWMQRRLLACGARPINNIVDITNYVLLEYGQPLHAFDFDRLAGGAILVRRANAKEALTTLEGTRRELSTEMLVIADAQRAVAVAGVMGGVGSEVSAQTRRVLLESALFDPVTVRRTARALGLASESSYRFERGVDPLGVEIASARAAALICEFGDGREVDRRDAGVRPPKPTVVVLESDRVRRWLGVPVAPSTIRTTLAKLSCRVASTGAGERMQVSVPSFRRDLRQDVDLYEELARLTGYDRLPATLPNRRIVQSRSEETARYWQVQSLRCLCASLGLTETINWMLISAADLASIGVSVEQSARVANPLSQDHAHLRPSLLVGLLHSVRRNLTQGAIGAGLFEVGRVVIPALRPLERERTRLGIALAGLWSRDWRTRTPCDFFQLKGLLETLTRRLCPGTLQAVAATQPWAQPAQSVELRLDGHVVGQAGQVAPRHVEGLDLRAEVWFAELDVEGLLRIARPTPTVSVPVTFPPVKRDLSILLDRAISFEVVDHVIREIGGALASRIDLIDRYTGTQVAPGTYSLTFAIEYRDAARTLTAAEVDALHQRIGQALVNRFNAQLR